MDCYSTSAPSYKVEAQSYSKTILVSLLTEVCTIPSVSPEPRQGYCVMYYKVIIFLRDSEYFYRFKAFKGTFIRI